MADDLIPPDVREFVLEKIEFIAHLEALLLLLHKTSQRWSASSVATQLYIDEGQARAIL